MKICVFINYYGSNGAEGINRRLGNKEKLMVFNGE